VHGVNVGRAPRHLPRSCRMLEQGEPGHTVNTSSIAALRATASTVFQDRSARDRDIARRPADTNIGVSCPSLDGE
jgi:hypothetical protein